MTEQNDDLDEITEKSKKSKLDMAQFLQDRINDNLDQIKKILDRCRKENIEVDKDEHTQDMLNLLLPTTLLMEVQQEDISDKYEELGKRPADMTTGDVPVLLKSLSISPEEVKGIMGKRHDSALDEPEVELIEQLCKSAAYELTEVPEGLDDVAGMAKYLKKAYGKLLLARRLLVYLKGYDLPDFTAKKIDKKDPKETDEEIDYHIWVAHEGIKKAIEWCDLLASSEPDAKHLVKGLDQALRAIAEADALVKGLDDSKKGKEP